MTELSPTASNLLIATLDQIQRLVSPGSSSKGWKTNTAGIGGSRPASVQHLHFDSNLAIDAALPVPGRIKKIGRHFKYFISPEDTTDMVDDRRSKAATYQSLNIFGILKTMFWMAVSIGLSLLVGNFC